MGENGESDDNCEGNNTVSFVLPSLPTSVNSLYNVIFSQRRVELKPECRLWKSQAKQRIPPFRIQEGSSVEIAAVFYFPFLWKNGKPRVFDASNLLKLLLDAIAEKCGFNDCLIRCGSWQAVDSRDEKVEVKLREVGAISVRQRS